MKLSHIPLRTLLKLQHSSDRKFHNNFLVSRTKVNRGIIYCVWFIFRYLISSNSISTYLFWAIVDGPLIVCFFTANGRSLYCILEQSSRSCNQFIVMLSALFLTCWILIIWLNALFSFYHLNLSRVEKCFFFFFSLL